MSRSAEFVARVSTVLAIALVGTGPAFAQLRGLIAEPGAAWSGIPVAAPAQTELLQNLFQAQGSLDLGERQIQLNAAIDGRTIGLLQGANLLPNAYFSRLQAAAQSPESLANEGEKLRGEYRQALSIAQISPLVQARAKAAAQERSRELMAELAEGRISADEFARAAAQVEALGVAFGPSVGEKASALRRVASEKTFEKALALAQALEDVRKQAESAALEAGDFAVTRAGGRSSSKSSAFGLQPAPKGHSAEAAPEESDNIVDWPVVGRQTYLALRPAFRTMDPRLRERILDYLETPSKDIPRFTEALLAVDDAYLAADREKIEATPEEDERDELRLVRDTRHMTANIDAYKKATGLIFHVKEMESLARLIFDRLPLEDKGIESPLEVGRKASEEMLPDLRKDARRKLLDIQQLVSLPAYKENVNTIRFEVHQPGISLHVTHGPFSKRLLEDKFSLDFQYDPSKFSRWGLMRRIFGEKPLAFTEKDVTITIDLDLAGRDRPFFNIVLKDGHRISISRDTGAAVFFPKNIGLWGIPGQIWSKAQLRFGWATLPGAWTSE